MSDVSAVLSIDDWLAADLVDPRPPVVQEVAASKLDAWPVVWKTRTVGLFSNKKPNADAMLEQVKESLLDVAPELTFVYGSKEALAQDADPDVMRRLSECDVVVLDSAECGGCTSWVCRDYITLEQLGTPCLVIATDRFELLARTVLARGGVGTPHMIVPAHPVSGITRERAKAKIAPLMPAVIAELGLLAPLESVAA